jgi:glycosyltransferase involved in cell wall biosynthesis
VKQNLKSPLRRTINRTLTFAAGNWRPYSRLMLVSDSNKWVLDWEMRELGRIARRLGIRLANPRWRFANLSQSVFFANQFFLLDDEWLKTRHHIGFSYFHGLPGTGDVLFDRVYESLCAHHARISRIQASHRNMRDAILQTGIAPKKVHLIPIGINLDLFPLRSPADKAQARHDLGIPQSAFVIGSFQKDGVGWEEGSEPKLVKGPDIFLSTINELKPRISELFVLLSAPARGYVKQGLERIGVPYKHLNLPDYPDIHKLYEALDVYLVTSRQEGGPKAILESMASGVPIVSTRVGQAADLVLHEKNGWLADVEDVGALAQCARLVYDRGDSALGPIIARGRATAESMSYASQLPLWADFMRGFVECDV